MVMLGTFILAFGWFGFNAGSSLAGGDGRIGIVAVNTMLAGMSATVCGVALHVDGHRQARPVDDVQQHARGPGRDHRRPARSSRRSARSSSAPSPACWSSGASSSSTRSKIDDPVGAISVHGVNGAWGLIAVGLFSDGSYGQGWNGVGATDYLGVAGQGVTGLFYGDSKQLVAQLIEVVVGVAWNVVVGGVAFFVIGKLVGNRVSAEVEIAGLDMPEMGAGLPGVRARPRRSRCVPSPRMAA